MSEDTPEFKYDVAISFLADDEVVAKALADRLSARWRVFVYFDRQEQLAGTDGMDRFSSVFRHEASFCVVLYRQKWGTTPWTAIEETAIKTRAFEGEWHRLFFVALTKEQPAPSWLPPFKLWCGFEEFGVEGTAAAIDARLQECGRVAHDETARDLAQRFAAVEAIQLQRERFISSEHGVSVARAETEVLWQRLQSEVDAIHEHVPALALRRTRDGYRLAHPKAHLLLTPSFRCINSLREDGIFVLEYLHEEGWPIFPESQYSPTGQDVLRFTLDDQGAPAWQFESDDSRYLDTAKLADRLVSRLLKLALS